VRSERETRRRACKAPLPAQLGSRSVWCATSSIVVLPLPHPYQPPSHARAHCRFPVHAGNGSLAFARCEQPNEMWVPLLEKAFAKLHGSYEALASGFVDTGLRDMTGLPTLTYQLPYSLVPPGMKRLWAAEYVCVWGGIELGALPCPWYKIIAVCGAPSPRVRPLGNCGAGTVVPKSTPLKRWRA
jgi:hypothetical protein